MQVPVRNIIGETVDEIELRDDIFAVDPHPTVMHQALVRQLANARQGTHSTKTRGQIKGTTAKWYRQKGTGRARHGNRKAPIFVGGGVAHGPKPRSYTKNMPKKMRRLALRSALSVKATADQIIVLDDIQFEEAKTRQMIDTLENLHVDGSAIVLLAEQNNNVQQSIRNLPHVKYLRAGYLNVRDLLGHDYILMPKASVETIERILG
ncbi:MAG: 50S ribosomal protein L4 [Anaerolineae bacterium]